MKKQEKILKALANLNRLKMLTYLKSHTDASVGSIADDCDVSFKNASKHLSILYQTDIVDRSRIHNETHYRISDTLHPIASAVIKHLHK